MKKLKGFTLIEILIALSIFAILATITSSTLYYAFNTRTRVNAQADQMSKLQLAISIVQQDILQIAERAIRGNDMRLFPVFIGQAHYVEFTRDGLTNPQSREKRSTLKRVAFACEEGKLIHRTWQSLDAMNRNEYQEKILIDNITECHFNYINQTLQTLTEWREGAVDQNQRAETLPKAIQINLTIKDWGEMNLLFIIAEALYAPS
jgi:general secretion pathway protein J